MKVIGLVGTSLSGKTSLAEALKEKHNQVIVVPEVTKGEICSYGRLPLSEKVTGEQLKVFDRTRIECQIFYEERAIQNPNYFSKIVVIDKSVLCVLMNFLISHGRNIKSSDVDGIVHMVLEHINNLYDTLVYLPYKGFHSTELNRTVINPYLLEIQSSCLEKMLDWVVGKNVQTFKLYTPELRERVSTLLAVINQKKVQASRFDKLCTSIKKLQ